jgi:copper chaperone CopZ
MKRVEDSVKNLPGVKGVDINHRTGSVLVHHEAREDMLPAVSTAVDGVAGEIFETLLELEGVEIPGLSIIAHLLGTNMSNLNNTMASATKNIVDLKTVLPMGFLVAGFHVARQNPGWWAEIPAWALFYYAYDSYLKFHPMIPTAVTEAAAEQTEVTEEIVVDNSRKKPKNVSTKGSA